jgi:hypothetical protein
MTIFDSIRSGVEIFEGLLAAYRASYFETSSQIVSDKLEKSDIPVVAP